MSVIDSKIFSIFKQNLQLPDDYKAENLQFSETPGWDSLAHMNIIAALEEAFDIMLDVDEIADMSDFAKAKEILDNHGIKN
jgi:acyl carrier protein